MRRIDLCCLAGLLLCAGWANASDIPGCKFEDTVDLTNHQRLANGFYLYEGVLIPPHLVGLYDYVEQFQQQRQRVEPHWRGCVCQLYNCMKFCCPATQVMQEGTGECVENERFRGLSSSHRINMTLDDGVSVRGHQLDDFLPQQGIPCKDGFMLKPWIYEMDEWFMFENTTIFRAADRAYLPRTDYCLTPFIVDGSAYVLSPVTCSIRDFTLGHKIIVVIISIPFMIATILVYTCLPHLHTLHGKCLICYLSSLAIGFAIHTFLSIAPELPPVLCTFLGFMCFYCFIAIFYWLSVISFDLFFSIDRESELTGKFRRYSWYAWGLPAMWTIVTISCQFSDIRNDLKPGIGDEQCFLNPSGWPAIIYLYGPSLPLLLFNLVMFTLTTVKIYEIKNQLQRSFTDGDEEYLRKLQDKVTLFSRLFIIMGLGWIFEVIAYVYEQYSENIEDNYFFVLTDIYNASQGIIIFAAFILKRSVWERIKTRIAC